MLGGGDDYTFYLQEHKKEDAESEFNIVDIGLFEIRKFIEEKDVNFTVWMDESLDLRRQKKMNWKKMISIPDDLINYKKNNNYIYDIITADEDFKKINANADAYKPTVLLNECLLL